MKQPSAYSQKDKGRTRDLWRHGECIFCTTAPSGERRPSQRCPYPALPSRPFPLPRGVLGAGCPRRGLPFVRLSGRAGSPLDTCRRRRARTPRWRHFGVAAGGGGSVPGASLGVSPGSPVPSPPPRRRQHECGGACARDGGRRAALERAAAQRAAPHHERQQPVSAPPAGGARGPRV